MSDENTQPESDISPVLATILLFAVLGVVLSLLLAQRPEVEVPEVTATEEVVEAIPTATLTPEPEIVGYHPDVVADGQQLYSGSCVGCHGGDARGIPGIGKDLVESDFMRGLSDEELTQFIIEGRGPFDDLNTTGIMMPARGGNPSLSDEDIMAIVVYLRTLDGAPIAEGASSAEVESVDTSDSADDTTDEVVESVDDTTDESDSDSTDEADETVYEPVEFTPIELFSSADAYNLSCAGCHGIDGTGVTGLSDNMLESDLVLADDSGAIFDYLTAVSAIGSTDSDAHPVNRASITLTDAELAAVVEYVRDLVPVEFDAESAFNWSCAGCHGIDGAGVDGLGDSILSADDIEAIDALLTTITPITSAEEGFVHPTYGGYPTLTDDQIQAVIEYLLTLEE